MTPIANSAALRLDPCEPQSEFLEDVLRGLTRTPKSLPCKYFYDERGSHLFDMICELDEYYPTRTELGIMRDSMDEIVDAIGSDTMIIEYGSGSGVKTDLLLRSLRQVRAYVPIDISREHLLHSAAALSDAHPSIEVLPVCADFTRAIELPAPARAERRKVVYFPGSTIGNFTDDEAHHFLARVARMCGPGGGLLIGVDLDKDVEMLEQAYDDARGVTADFNLNLLDRINVELGANFQREHFRHRAIYNRARRRIEMYIVSTRPQVVRVCGTTFAFVEGEAICTEYSHKYTIEGFARLARAADLRVRRVWTDPERLFSVQYLTVG